MFEQQPPTAVTREELSAVWKDGGNVKWGLKLDLVNHLKQQRENAEWVVLKKKVLEQVLLHLPRDRPVNVLELGCGLGIDIIDLVKAISEVNKHPGSRVVGLDFNSEMVTYCKCSLQEQQEAGQLPPSSHVSIEFIQENALKMESIPDNTFDVVRSDIALQHMNPMVDVLTQVKRVLKVGGIYAALEGAAGAGFFCADEYVRKIYNTVLPALVDGGTGVKVFFELKKLGFEVPFYCYSGIQQRGAALIAADPGWIKMKGVGNMLVDKGVLSREDADEYLKRFTKAAENDEILSLGGCGQIVAKKV